MRASGDEFGFNWQHPDVPPTGGVLGTSHHDNPPTAREVLEMPPVYPTVDDFGRVLDEFGDPITAVYGGAGEQPPEFDDYEAAVRHHHLGRQLIRDVPEPDDGILPRRYTGVRGLPPGAVEPNFKITKPPEETK